MDLKYSGEYGLQKIIEDHGAKKVCHKGWNDNESNSTGRCCCNCVYQRPIVAHPWNSNEFAKGPMTKVIGFGCCPPDLAPEIAFFDHVHGMCELHSRKS